MKYRTLNRILFGFCITVPITELQSLKEEKQPHIADFAVGDFVKFVGDESGDCEVMTVVGFLQPNYVQVVQTGIDFVEDYVIYDVYPEDIEVISISKIYRKCLLHYV